MNNNTRTIRSEEITIDMRVLTIMEDGRKNGEIYLAAIAPDMELTVITLDEAPDILPCFDEDLNVRFSTETELKKIQDFLYEKSGQGVSFTGLVEAMVNEVTIVTAVHNIKSNKGSKTAGVDKIKMDKYLQMPKDELILLIQSCFRNYRPKPARREYIEKSNGKKRPLGIPTVLDRIIQECVRIIIEPICEARFYPQSYGFRPYRAQKHAIRGIINVINAGCKSPDQPVWAIEGDIKGCFDNINHRLLLQKLWRIGIHDKRVLKIISQMLKAGYMENDLFHATELGTPQGGILSPLLSNVYLNDFDWYVGRMYMEPHRQCKHAEENCSFPDFSLCRFSGSAGKVAAHSVQLYSRPADALHLRLRHLYRLLPTLDSVLYPAGSRICLLHSLFRCDRHHRGHPAIQ